ncbi:MAG: ATP-binding protein [Gemmatimonadota bacterium]|nr:ATP-binding protein [Gemmatimonadota bacterium]
MSGQKSLTSSNGMILELEIPSLPENAAYVDKIIDELTAKAKYDEPMRGDITVAVNEVVKNAILHGNKCDGGKLVGIMCTCGPSEFRILVTDCGEGFVPGDVPDPLEPDNLLKESGRGLLISRTLMDEVSVENSGEGTKVTLVKKYQA